MQDRVPLYPGRVKLNPVSGQANTFDLTRADQPTQEGTPINKASLLKDTTAALFGLGTGAVPDDVLAELGKYKQYWWRRRAKTVVEKRTNITGEVQVTDVKVPAQLVEGVVQTGDWQYVQSSNRNAYPDSGIQDGYEYEYLGIPFDSAVTAPKIDTGFYTGTGTYDSKNKTSITFPFVPKWLMIYDKSFASYAFWNDLMTSPMTTHINYTTGRSATFSFDGFTLSWYAENAASQLNTENRIFYYIAIG